MLQTTQFSVDARQQFLDETLHHTLFTGTYRQHVDLFHGGDVQVLCLDTPVKPFLSLAWRNNKGKKPVGGKINQPGE